MTFSIAARCEETGMFGLAVSSSSPAVAARCAYARAGVGAVASQNITDPTLGPKALDLMSRGLSATDAINTLVADEPFVAYRQLTAIDVMGRTAHFSGDGTLGCNAVAEGKNVVCAGNLLANEEVPQAMVAAFGKSGGVLGDRMLVAMKAALAAGGEEGPVHSAGLYLVRDVAWPIADLRVDWREEDPVGALADLWELYKPQLEAYVTRALDPREAPSYGVPGDA
ncbi:DUF1028 domain-containing protein [Pelagibius sp. Alg239-R121]|uniref:DUF1028 domain-containing protein n=1 Tax=Pelagibius sp. Alg239-R121 TaxID=2993448 RepID=UPI0024A62379|nr:DUF1028 domain-containing protein [Pelagibius sp. Alg239-R121]